MPRTHFHASALPLALLLAGTAACGGGPRYARTAPAPVPATAPLADSTPAPAAAEPEKVDEPFAIERVRNGLVGRELLGSATYDLPVEPNQWVATELDFLVNQRHDVVGRWLERSERYSAFVQETFAAAGIPRDLHHLAMVESGYQPTVRSHAGAVGMWQFMSATGRGMGLRIDDQVDERMDPVRSTRAAARHLRALHDDFGGSWALAAAAYNAGGGRISRGLASYGATDFWDLASRGNLAQETRRYVPRLFAVTIIAKDPARFGYARPSGVVRRFEFDSIQVDLPTPLPILARIANLSLGDLSELNPHLVRGVVPAFYWLWVPRGNGPATQQAYATSDYRRRGGFQSYTLRRGEDARKIALASNLTLEQLRDLNLSTNIDQLGRGDRIRLYADAVRALDARPVDRAASRDEGGVDGESAARRRTEADDEASSTRTASSRRASSDETEETRTTRHSRSSAADDEGTSTRPASSRRSSDDESPRRARSSAVDGETSSARSASNRRASDDESPRRRRQEESTPSLASILRHTVEQGETLMAIGRKYDVTAAQLREANDLGLGAVLQPGQKLRIPRASPRAAAADRAESRPAAERRRASDDARPASHGRVAQHVVKSGETLWSIARSYDTTVAAIRDANEMHADSVLQPGQTLRIPRPARDSDR
jgi:membrane-bound lytic murein transglycosylase D